VNYGNRFVPEDWMRHPYNFFKSVRRSRPFLRVALWDLQPGGDGGDAAGGPRSRMLKWLDATIKEEHFATMRRMGVQVVRVPCGYWNWVTFPEGAGPVAPACWAGVRVAEKLKNLHRIATPEEYQVYFDRIFAYARAHGIKVLLDLHGLPGSQNGEIHSGVCLEVGEAENRTCFFQNEANKETAVRAVQAMARYASGSGKAETLFGIQVINEPHLKSEDEGHSFLQDYYRRAILAARESLDASVPIVLFEWTYGMERWEHHAFPQREYGRVLWDTHLYHFPDEGERWTSSEGGLQKAREAYRWDLEQMRRFSARQGGAVLVGEFSLAGQSLRKEERLELAQWLVDQFDFGAQGSLLWTFDEVSTAWSMRRQRELWGIDWRQVTHTRRYPTVQGSPVSLQVAQGGETLWLSAHKDGGVCLVEDEASWSEEWVPYRYRVDGELRVALRSSARGTWLTVDEGGKVSQADMRSLWEEFRVVPLRRGSDDGDDSQRVGLISAHGTWLAALRDLRLVLALPASSCPSSAEEEAAEGAYAALWTVA